MWNENANLFNLVNCYLTRCDISATFLKNCMNEAMVERFDPFKLCSTPQGHLSEVFWWLDGLESPIFDRVTPDLVVGGGVGDLVGKTGFVAH